MNVVRGGPPARVNGWAVGSLVLSVTCCAPVAVVGALVALHQIDQSGGRMRGRGLALAAIAIVAVQFAVAALAVINAFVTP